MKLITIMFSLRWLPLLLSLLIPALSAFANDGQEEMLTLPPLFSDHMVLQREQDVPVWGRGVADREVVVALGDEQARTRVDAQGNWQLKLPAREAGGPYTLRVRSGENLIRFRDVYLGDVWLMAGQSNMAFRFSQSRESDKSTAYDALPGRLIRSFEVPKIVTGGRLLDRTPTSWEVADASTIDDWSAVALYFALALEQDSPVAVGLINSSQGSSTLEAWMTSDALASAGGHPPPVFDDIRRHYRTPSVLYETMLSGLVPYGLKGVVWYQGESNADRAGDYQKRLPAMIKSWRLLWQRADMPFLLVQLPVYEPPHDASGTQWAELRAAQAEIARAVPGVTMAVTIDTGEKDNIHPSAKKVVGDRLAALARAVVYAETVPYRGPSPAAISYREDRADVTFHHADGGLMVSGESLSMAFSVLGSDGQWRGAQATVQGRTVSLYHPQELAIAGVRHAWANAPEITLYNVQGYPAVPFEDKKSKASVLFDQ